MNGIKRFIQIFVIIILIGIIGIVVFLTYIYYDTKPVLDGIIYADGISNNTEIIRDEYGIPHIFARNDIDAYFSLGYSVAQDRLWQMDFIRRLSAGNLTEILGEKYYELDVKMKTLSIYRQAEEISEYLLNNKYELHYIKCILSYLEGINTYLKHIGNDLPIEFRILSYTPDEFKLKDIYAVNGLIRYSMLIDKSILYNIINHIDINELNKLDIVKEITQEEENELIPYLNKARSIGSFNPVWDDSKIDQHILSGLKPDGFSLALHPEKTYNKKSMLITSVEIGTNIPSLFYEAHIATPQQNFYGYFLPLSPFGLFGHNTYISWGISDSFLDDTDFYFVEINPENPNQYMMNGVWNDFKLINYEIISKKDNMKENVIVRLTELGPVISNGKNVDGKNIVLVFKWGFYDSIKIINEYKNDYYESLFIINHSEDFDQFREGLLYYNGMGLNFTFTDTFNNIALISAGNIPKRNKDLLRLIVKEVNEDTIWNEYIIRKKIVSDINPNSHFITGKGSLLDEDKLITSTFKQYNLFNERVEDLLKNNINFNIDDAKRLLNDKYDSLAGEVLEILKQYLGEIPDFELTEEDIKLINYLEDWNYKVVNEKPETLLFYEFYNQIIKNTLVDELGNLGVDKLIQDSFFYSLFANLLLNNKDSYIFDNIKTEKIENYKDILLLSLKDTINNLSSLLGKNIDKWVWRSLFNLRFDHLLGDNFPFNIIFNLNNINIISSSGTLNKSSYNFYDRFKALKTTNVFMISNTDNLNNTLFLNIPGNSGHFNNYNYKNQIELFNNMIFRNPINNKEDAYKIMVDRIKIVPTSNN